MKKKKAALATALLFSAAGCGSLGAQPDADVGKMPGDGPVAKTMRANSEKFKVCGRDSVSVQTGTEQKLQLRFWVSPEGSVTKAKVENMKGPDPDLHVCIVRALKKMKFPPPSDGKDTEITYPLTLRPE